jgi:hypothetical protein
MMKFGKYAVLDNSTHTFEKEPDWTWSFRPPTSKDEAAYGKWEYENYTEVEVGGEKKYLLPPWYERAWMQLSYSFGGTNIEMDGKPILVLGAPQKEVYAVVTEMPFDMVTELWVALGEAYPFWGPQLVKEETQEEEVESAESPPEE